MKRKIVVVLLLVAMLMGMMPILAIDAAASTTYYINGVSVRYDDPDYYPSAPKDCWNYANAVYYKIWKTKFSNAFNDQNNYLRNLSDSELTLTEEHLKEYVSNAELGSCLRVCDSEYLHVNSDGWGHSQIIVQKDSDGFTVIEGGLDTYPHCREKYYTWSEYLNTDWLGYEYIKYIKWPDAPEYSSDSAYLSLCSELYPSYGEATLKYDCNLHPLPCSNTEAQKYGYSSVAKEALSAGQGIKIHGIIMNTANHYWYKVTTESGQTGYVYSAEAYTMTQLWPYVEGEIMPASISGSTLLGGSVIAGGSRIDSVSAFVCRGTSVGTRILSSDIDYVSTTERYSLCRSDVDYSLPFQDLANYGNGYYTIGIEVGVTNYYLDEDRSLDYIAWCIIAGTDTFEFIGGSSSIQTYTVAFNANGGSGAPGSIDAQDGDAVTLPTTIPTRWGYNFTGWATSSGGEVIYQPGDYITVTSDITLYAKWTRCTNYFGTGSSYSSYVNYPGAGCWEIIVPGETGDYSIEGLSTVDTRASLYDANGTLLTSDDDGAGNLQFLLQYYLFEDEYYYLYLEFYSSSETGSIDWCIGKEGQCVISFDANGGDYAPGSIVAQAGETVTIPYEYPTQWGTNFVGWATVSNSWYAEYYPGDTITVESDMTLYANWVGHIIDQTEYIAASFDIRYPGQGYYICIQPQVTGSYVMQGLDTSDTRAILYDSYGNLLTECDDANGSHQFLIEWDMVAGEEYYLWIGFYSEEETGYLDFQLERKYECTVSFDEGTYGEISAEVGTAVTIPEEVPYLWGRNFAFWYCSEHDCFYYPGDTIIVDQNLTMISYWYYNGMTVSLWETYDANIDYAGMGCFVAVEVEESGWYGIIGLDTADTSAILYDAYGSILASDDDSAGGLQFLINYYLDAGETYYLCVRYYHSDVTGTIPFHVGRECFVTYDANGGYGAPDVQTGYMGMLLTLSNLIPQREGYTFLGWAFTEVASEGLYLPGEEIVADNLNLRAIWYRDDVQETSLGDVNGDGKVDTTDAKLVMQYDLGLIDETALTLEGADVNGDGSVDTTDAKLIMQLDLGLIEQFP